MNTNSTTSTHYQSTCVNYQKDLLQEGMNLCQRRNDSIKRLISSDKDSFDLDDAWADIVATCAANAGKTFTESWSAISISNSASIPWSQGVLAPGGIIYGVPYHNAQILRIDTNTDTASLYGSFSGNYDYCCGALAPNGFIYCLPGTATNILKIDPKTDTYTTVGDVSALGSVNKWGGACVAPNGCIYGVPIKTNKILKFNPRTENITYIDTNYSIPSEGLWQDAMLGRNGCIYCTPRASIPYLKIDPKTNTYTTFGGNGPRSYPWGALAIAPNERIYTPGYKDSRVLKINTDSNSLSTISSYSGSQGCVLAPNGYIYGVPRDYNYIVRINPANDDVTKISTSWCDQGNAVLATNGCIYVLPNYNAGINRIFKIDPGVDVCQNFKESTLLSPYLNKY